MTNVTESVMPTVGVIGAGLIGRSWAMVFARAGWDVKITDTSSAAMEAAQSILTVGILRAHLTPTADIFSSKSPFHGIFWT